MPPARVDLGSCWAHFGVALGSLWDQCGIMFWVLDSDSDFWVPGPILFKQISFYCSFGSQDLPEKLNWVGDLNFNGVFAQNC